MRYLEILVRNFDLKWVSHLLNLQTLIVQSLEDRRTSSPVALWKMPKLRLVQLNGLLSEWEDNDRAFFEESSTMLENLKIFRIGFIYVDDTAPRFWWRFPIIEEMELYIYHEPSCPLFPLVEVHTRLHSLTLASSNAEFWAVGWESYCVLPSNIRCLSLNSSFLMEVMVSNIARLRKLDELRISWIFCSKNNYWDVTNVEFPSLKYLILESVQMKGWKASDESFPVLEKLVVEFCYDLEEIPPSFVDIPTLRYIRLIQCSNSLGDSAMSIKKEIEENTGSDTLQVDIRKFY